MKQHRLTNLALTAALVVSGIGGSAAANWVPQEGQPATQGDSTNQNRPAVPENDPFFRYQPPKPKAAKKIEPEKPIPIAPPTLEQRQQDFKRAKAQAKASRQPEPNPIGQFLVSELTVAGIYETETGYGAFVVAPDKTTHFVERGTKVYNGELIDIRAKDDPPQVVFRERIDYQYKRQVQPDIHEVVKQVGAPRGS